MDMKYNQLAKEMIALNEINIRIHSSMVNPDEAAFYKDIVDTIQEKLGYEYIGIHTLDPSLEPTLVAEVGIQNDFNIKANIDKAARERRSIVLPNSVQIYAPVICNSEILAVINILNKDLSEFKTDDIIVIEALAVQTGIALTNKKFYKKTLSFNAQLKNSVEDKRRELSSIKTSIQKQSEYISKSHVATTGERNIIGRSPSLVSVLGMVDKISGSDATVLIQGESGTGKELIANRLHFRSTRRSKPFVTINCGALQESLLESELFGHEKGSFTGAVSQKVGLAETADGGTLFLDEIGELSQPIQAKLLRFLNSGEFYRIGGKKPIHVNVRILSATNKDLEKEVKERRFREDLFYRLNTITLRVPPLRERREDIPLLINHFLNDTDTGNSAEIPVINEEVIDALMVYRWPGNIRELQNSIERMKILAENGRISCNELPRSIKNPEKPKLKNLSMVTEMKLEEVERMHILQVLEHHGGNKTRAAKSLGITIKTLYNKLERYGIKPEQNN